MLEQLPVDIQDDIYYKYLYQKFIDQYERYFTFEKKFTKIKCNFYSWGDQVYREFMIEVLQKLEPRREFAGTILF